jgi:hypothetical protein
MYGQNCNAVAHGRGSTVKEGATLLTTNRRDLTAEEKAVLKPDTILQDILAAKKQGNLAIEDMKEWGARVFAELNGWRWSADAWFMPEDLGGFGNSYKGMAYSWGDHPLFFRAPRPDGRKGWVNQAIVGQPYTWAGMVEQEVRGLQQKGYGVALPPSARASLHFPGATLFIVVTKAPQIIKFMAEQHTLGESVFVAPRSGNVVDLTGGVNVHACVPCVFFSPTYYLGNI